MFFKSHENLLSKFFFKPVKGGVENQMYYIAKHLVSKGYKVDIFVSDRLREGKIKEKFEVIDGINVYRFKSWFKFSFSGIFFPILSNCIEIPMPKFDYPFHNS